MLLQWKHTFHHQGNTLVLLAPVFVLLCNRSPTGYPHVSEEENQEVLYILSAFFWLFTEAPVSTLAVTLIHSLTNSKTHPFIPVSLSCPLADAKRWCHTLGVPINSTLSRQYADTCENVVWINTFDKHPQSASVCARTCVFMIWIK